ncbi:MAG: hypothetical protein KIT61_01545 [Pyrinomonadaceae bacterium]|nr:hypothetical protein [Pyrinomonadaceae bacterium]
MINRKQLLENPATSSLTTVHSPLPTVFLGLTHVGTSNEAIHLGPEYRDPAIKPARRRKDDDLIDFFLSGKYARYLER